MRRPLRQCADFAKWTLVIALVAFTLVLLGGRFVVNQLSFYRTSIETRLSDALGIPVSTSRVTGDWQGVLPLISLEAVSMGGDEPFLTIGSVELEPDYMRSLLYQTLVVRQMQIDNLELSFREDANGRWLLGDLTGAGGADAQSRRRLLNTLTESQSIILRDTRIDLLFYNGRRMQLGVDSMTAANDADFHRFVAQVSEASQDRQVRVIAEMGDSFEDGSGRIGKAYLDISSHGTQGGPLESIFATLEPSADEQTLQDQPATLNAEIWVDIFPDWTLQYSGTLAANSLPTGWGLVNYRSDLAGIASYGGELRVDFIHPIFELDSSELPIFDFSLSQRGGADSNIVSFATSEFALGEFYSRLVDQDLLSGRLAEVLAQLNPRGVVRNLFVDMDTRDPVGSLRIRGNLDNVDLDAFVRAPSVDNLSGYFEAGAKQGYIQIDAENIAPFYEGIYAQPFYHERMTGVVAWEVDPERSAVEVFANNLRIEGPEGDIYGAFRLEAPLRRRAFSTDLTIDVGLVNSSSGHRMTLVPQTLPDNLYRWLADSIGMGVVPQASFVYRGKLGRTPMEQTVQLNLAVRQGELNFVPGWPTLNRLDANLLVNNGNVNVTASRAYLRDIDVSGAVVNIYSDSSTRINIASAFRGEANQVLDLLRDTPVRGRVGRGLDDFDMSGSLLGTVQLDFPLSGSFPIEELQADIAADLSGNRLILGQRNLEIDALQGTIHFDQSGLRADSIDGQLWSRPIELVVSTEDRIRIDLNTEIGVPDLADWLNTGWLESLEGVARVTGEIAIGGPGGEQQTSYRFHSTLEGIRSDLPEPLSKSADQQLQLEVASAYQQGGSVLSMQLGEQLEFSMLRSDEGVLQHASLGLNAPAPQGQPGQLNGLVSLGSLQVDEWTNLLSASSADETAGLGLDPHIELSTQNVVLGGRSFGAVHALLNREDDLWGIDFASVWGQGVYRFQGLNDQNTAVPQLHFSALDLKAWQEAVADSGSEETDPRTLPRLDLIIDQLDFGERSLGRWAFQVNPTPDGVELLNLSADRDDVHLVSADNATRFLWNYDGQSHFTQLDLSLEFGDASQLFDMMGQPSPISSDSGSLYSSFAWQGRPAEMFAQPLSGIMGIRLEDGEFDTQIEGVGSALMRVIGLFNINSWARRLQFDFSDVTARGTSYDRVRGDFVLDEGVLTTLTPVDARLTSGRMRIDGQVNLNDDTVDAQLVATLPLRENMTWVTGLVAGLPAAAGVWLIGKLFQDEVDNLTSVSYRITGDLEDPDVKTERVLESTIGGG